MPPSFPICLKNVTEKLMSFKWLISGVINVLWLDLVFHPALPCLARRAKWMSPAPALEKCEGLGDLGQIKQPSDFLGTWYPKQSLGALLSQSFWLLAPHTVATRLIKGHWSLWAVSGCFWMNYQALAEQNRGLVQPAPGQVLGCLIKGETSLPWDVRRGGGCESNANSYFCLLSGRWETKSKGTAQGAGELVVKKIIKKK